MIQRAVLAKMRKNLVDDGTAPGGFDWAREVIAKFGKLTGEGWALVLEINTRKPLPHDLREALIGALLNPKKLARPRGRPPFISEEKLVDIAHAFAKYEDRLVFHQAARETQKRADKASNYKRSRAERTANELALADAADHVGMTAGALRSIFSRLSLLEGRKRKASSTSK